jgi:hypothetical protein
MSAGCSKR